MLGLIGQRGSVLNGYALGNRQAIVIVSGGNSRGGQSRTFDKTRLILTSGDGSNRILIAVFNFIVNNRIGNGLLVNFFVRKRSSVILGISFRFILVLRNRGNLDFSSRLRN